MSTATVVVTDERHLGCPDCDDLFVGNKSDPGAWADFLDQLQDHNCADTLYEMRYAVTSMYVYFAGGKYTELGEEPVYTLLGEGEIDPEEYLHELDDPDYDG